MPFRALSLLLACVPLFCSSAVQADDFQFRDQERVVFVGGSLAERMNLFGHFENLLHSRFPEKQLVIRNFGWPADEVGIQQRPGNYYRIDDPLEVFGPELFLCFFGFNEHFAGDTEADVKQIQDRYRDWINRSSEKYSKPGREARFVLISPMAFENANDRHLSDGKQNNQSLKKYSAAIQALAAELDLPFVDVLTASSQAFASEPGKQFTTNGIHVTDRNRGPSGSYVLDPMSQRFRYFKTPGYGNPWCMVFDRWGMGVIGDGTNAQQHWASPLSGFNVSSRRTLRPLFYNQGMRPACGSEFLVSRHLPDSIQGQFIYACVINMHGLPRFDVADEDGTAGYVGKRIENLLESEDGFFRPIDPQIGPDGAVWFGDWCNALIGHMQYSQRDPNRDHEHGRIYRLVNKNKPLVQPELPAEATIPELLDQLQSYELRTRYRARRELRARPQADVLNAVNQWIAGEASAEKLAEALWVQEGARAVDPALVARLMKSDNFHARSAAVHTVANEMLRFDFALDVIRQAIKDEHPRVRLEAIRALSFVQTYEALEIVLLAVDQPLDYWWEYTMEHTLLALRKMGGEADSRGELLVNSSETAREYYDLFLRSTGPGGEAIKPLLVAQDEEASASAKALAVR
ncbi:MAG: HEAT repeat domain-containing protein [Fuerstiella sp.]